jgi:hypothetical protein
MSLLSRLFKKAPKMTKIFPLPADWTPAAPMIRIIPHWTAGGYIASSLDKEHYHFLIEGDLDVVRGHRSILDNVNIAGKTSDDYAAHTRGCNTKAIGIALCASAGAEESPYKPGKCPVTEAQWDRMAGVIAHLCKVYRIPVTDKTVLTHAEVQKNLGIQQAGKWDIAKLPFGGLVTAKACGDDLRRRVMEAMK